MPIYLDYAATTPVDSRVAQKMHDYLTMDGCFGNPASHSHLFGWEAEKAVNWAREQVAHLIHASPKEIIWTSGATESNNLAIKGAAQFHQKKGRHIITSKTEHKAVLDPCHYLSQAGFEVTYLDPDANGIITLETVRSAVRDDTTLVSVMYANNETGTLNDIASIGEFTRANGIVFHVDGAQAAGKVNVDVNTENIDLLSLNAHKIYGPKGIGALYVRRKPRMRLAAQIHGGGHERGFRSGTLPTHQIIGMGEAYRIANDELSADQTHVKSLANQLWDGLKNLPEVYMNGANAPRIDNIMNISFGFVEGDALMRAVSELAVSSGSACTSGSVEPSYVLRALGVPDDLASSSIRFSFGRMTTEADIRRTVELMLVEVEKLRQLSPLWTVRQNGISHSNATEF